MKPNETLRIIRIANDYSIADVVDQIGLTSSYISEVECGKRKLSTNLLKKFTLCYKLPASVIMKLMELSEEKDWDFKKTLYEILKAYYMENPRSIIMMD